LALNIKKRKKMKKILILFFCGIFTVSLYSQNLKNNMDSLSYSVGLLVAKNLKSQGISDLKIDAFTLAVEDVMKDNELKMDIAQAQSIFQEYAQKAQQKQADDAKADGEAFLAENAKREGVTSLPSGLQYEIMKSGEEGGKSPKPSNKVVAHYHGTLIDGTVFDSSVERGEPATFPVNGVIQGWQEILQLMKVGDKWKVFIPQNLAYGSRGAGAQIPPYSALIFEIELLEIQ
jgi:FKBP-type peptidyl-prolyl cis-trans isomerase FklB